MEKMHERKNKEIYIQRCHDPFVRPAIGLKKREVFGKRFCVYYRNPPIISLSFALDGKKQLCPPDPDVVSSLGIVFVRPGRKVV
jgi:hypothetical protein